MKKKVFKICKYFILSLFCILIGTGALIFIYVKTSPNIEIKSANSFLMYDSNNELFFKGSGEKEWVDLKDISKYVILATINTEDKNFYNHFGLDIFRIMKAISVNIGSKSAKQGASTISQQYAKNLFLDFNKTWKRKIKELFITLKIEDSYSKDQILEGYLNTINYGHGMYGIENASNYYFNKKASELTLAEACMLVGIPKSPSNYSPFINYGISKKRQNNILKKLLDNNKITKEEYNNALYEEVKLYGKKEIKNLTSIMYYQDAVIRELKSIKEIPDSYLETGGLKIYTNLDLNAQESLEKAIKNNINSDSDIQASGILMNPKNGNVIALVGGINYNKSQYNRAYLSSRQIGSTMKPLLYYAALENGFTASSSFLSTKTTFNFSDKSTYTPQNAGDTYGNKPISLGAAISYSDNVYAIKTHMFLGDGTLTNISKKLGITSKLDEVASLPLGTSSINMLEISDAYSSFANLGKRVKHSFISKVTDLNDNVIYEKKDDNKKILDSSLCFILNNLLTSTYDSSFIDYNYPTAIGIKAKIKHKLALKSGTTNTDGWAIGFNNQVLSAIWVGYDNNKDLANSEFKLSKNIWVDSIEGYLKDNDDSWYQQPKNVVGVLVNPITGKLVKDNDKNKKIFYYIKGTEPSN